MKSFLDNLGVKRLTQNIRDWAESKFIDSDYYEYDAFEIEHLVLYKKLKAGKVYKINYAYDLNRIVFKQSYARPTFRGKAEYLYLRAINENTFDENAYFNPSTYPVKFIPIKFKYGYYDTNIQEKEEYDYVSEVHSTDAKYEFASIINKGNNILFKRTAGNPDAQDQLIVDRNDIKHNNVINVNGTKITIQYSGLGTITWMKDENGNETNFNNYILKVTPQPVQPVQGSNNIVKSDIGFGTINGNNNIIINSQNLNIEEDNLIYVNNIKY